mmetsp:Transcript_42527/g.110737  ORF Transcript_42527/g.110737 Transcript_42527/m.110737 type:complete len:339 (-) Transcript_42527:749-1765(-)
MPGVELIADEPRHAARGVGESVAEFLRAPLHPLRALARAGPGPPDAIVGLPVEGAPHAVLVPRGPMAAAGADAARVPLVIGAVQVKGGTAAVQAVPRVALEPAHELHHAGVAAGLDEAGVWACVPPCIDGGAVVHAKSRGKRAAVAPVGVLEDAPRFRVAGVRGVNDVDGIRARRKHFVVLICRWKQVAQVRVVELHRHLDRAEHGGVAGVVHDPDVVARAIDRDTIAPDSRPSWIRSRRLRNLVSGDEDVVHVPREGAAPKADIVVAVAPENVVFDVDVVRVAVDVDAVCPAFEHGHAFDGDVVIGVHVHLVRASSEEARLGRRGAVAALRPAHLAV